jgi:hypothetical protein
MEASGFSSRQDIVDFASHLKEILYEDAKQEHLIDLLKKWYSLKYKITSGQWLELSMYLLSMGLFKSSYECRLISYKAFSPRLNKLIYNFNYQQLRLAKLFDEGELAEFKKYWNTSVTSNNGYWRSIIGNSTKVDKNLDEDFYNLIRNKRVAVIGPLEFDKDYSDEIANYDVVVELNALESKRESAKKKYHGVPDIVYYNNSRLEELKKLNYDDIPDTSKFVVLKNPKHQAALKRNVSVRVLPQTTTLNWNGSFSMMENTIADLLLFNPSEIKIYGVNLYTSFNYDKAYGNEPPENLKKITLNFTVHDIFTQYAFMHNLYNLGLIKGDDGFEKVLKLGRKGYVERMSELYPKYLIK